MRIARSSAGLTALITVMVLGSVALLTSVVIALRGISEVDLGITSLQGQQADTLLVSCNEEAMYQLSLDPTYATQETVTVELPEGKCTVDVSSIPSAQLPTASIILHAQRGRSIKCADVTLVVPLMEIASWRQIACPE